MANDQTVAPVIIKRKKIIAADGHHGGAWKVAYADFVTAMMAFFIVCWGCGRNCQGVSGESAETDNIMKHIVTRVTDEGLVVEFYDSNENTLFDNDNKPTPLLNAVKMRVYSFDNSNNTMTMVLQR